MPVSPVVLASRWLYEGVTVTAANHSLEVVGLQDVVDEGRIRAFHAGHVDAVKRRAWEEFKDLFLPDAHLTVVRGDAAPDVVIPVAGGFHRG
jgi:hypothetical protein